MRLLDTTTLQLTEFIGEQLPRYAILSHTWAHDEVLFQDLQHDPSAKAGWTKVLAACQLARDRGYSWIWIDTCCIDKSSSSELSEAINSMFRWYRDADMCFAYLSDVPHTEPGTAECNAVFSASRWFTRGWTLQELLAPSSLDFYSSDWRRIASRRRLSDVIERTTGIHAAYLSGHPLRNSSVAARMSWASNRETTRPEDMAYALLGIFDVNMPLIYGEGAKAFRRLQETILRDVDDQSLFAWGPVYEGDASGVLDKTTLPLFAEEPSWFRASGDIVPFRPRGVETRLRVAHDGVTIATPLWKKRDSSSWIKRPNHVYLAPLQCQQKGNFLNGIAMWVYCPVEDFDEVALGSSSVPFYRISLTLLTIPKTAWRKENLCSAFLYFANRERRNAIETVDDKGCVIRTLPQGYRASEMYSRGWGLGRTTAIIPFTSRMIRSYGLGIPVVVRLTSLEGPDLALVLQYQYLSLVNGDSVGFPLVPGWMVNRVVDIPSGMTIEDVAMVVEEESDVWTAEDVRQMSSAAWEGQRVEDRSSSGSSRRSRLQTRTRFRVSLSNEEVHGPLIFLVDVEDLEGANRSLEVFHGENFVLAKNNSR
ncbi:Vegetative incompatibility protein HET-E-1-like protein 18 [Colletotrichum chlorophyti]|uniref:Vegetative incompatibility protein HET-E-1-like protein 18 n=1 Tax=Colletotrichum chlorophyti TaxID=708187 RepID=A0A1Q8RC68_9PEZI|nr:Vegetative incompatibility protein HET-E-1-like protein 18 [Colletotrichum chlorophyti]